MTQIIAVVNHKGGVGKTTTAVNISAGLARKKQRVLLIDLDPQGHATWGVGINLEDSDQPTVADVFGEKNLPLESVIVDTREEYLKVAPTDIELVKSRILLELRPFKELALNKALNPIKEHFNYIVIDCQPNLDTLVINALVASNRILIPTEFTGYALKGLSYLIATLHNIKAGEDFDWRILATRVSDRYKNRQERAEKILEPVNEKILRTRVRLNDPVEESQMESEEEESLVPVVLQKKWSKGAKDYRDLVTEIIELWPD